MSMHHKSKEAWENRHLAQNGAVTIAFSDDFHRMVGRSQVQSEDIEAATLPEIIETLELARQTLTVAADDVVKATFAHNSDCFRIVRRGTLAESAMMAYLPLTSEGVAALVCNEFDGLAPDRAHICVKGESPEALYLWLMFTPGDMVTGLRLVQELEQIGHGVPIFTRAAHNVSDRILRKSGFLSACELFPQAPAALLVALTSALPRNHIDLRVVRTFDDLSKVFLVRNATYMAEQECTFAEEFDGNDFCGTHILGEVNGEPAGCVRIRYFGNFAKLERLAVCPQYRQSRLMWKLVRAAFEHCARKGFRKLYAHARHDLVPAWERFGARPVEGRKAFFFSDVKFREMELDLPAHNRAISFGADPLLIIRPEGEWDHFGPIEHSQLRHSGARRHTIEKGRKFA